MHHIPRKVLNYQDHDTLPTIPFRLKRLTHRVGGVNRSLANSSHLPFCHRSCILFKQLHMPFPRQLKTHGWQTNMRMHRASLFSECPTQLVEVLHWDCIPSWFPLSGQFCVSPLPLINNVFTNIPTPCLFSSISEAAFEETQPGIVGTRS
jgi:hypothetical protein